MATSGEITSKTALQAVMMLVLVNVIWGLNIPFSKLAVEDVSPYTYNATRATLSIMILVPLGIRTGMLELIRRRWRAMVVAGMLGLVISQTALAIALTLTPGAIVAVIHALGPAVIVLLAIPFLGERMQWSGWIGMALAICGALLVLGLSPSELDAHRGEAILGTCILIVGISSWWGFSVFAKRSLGNENLTAMAAAVTLFGWVGIVLVWGVSLPAGQGAGGWTAEAVLGVVWAGGVNRGLAFLGLNWALQRLEGSRVGGVSYLLPVVGVLGAWAILGEEPGLTFFIGSALALAGVYLVTTAHIRKVDVEPVPLDSSVSPQSAAR